MNLLSNGNPTTSTIRRLSRRSFVLGALATGAGLSRALPALAASGGPAAYTAARPAAASRLAITGVTVIDMTGAAPLSNMTVVIEGDRIASIRPSDAAEQLEGARVIDGAGRFLIPGLWDAHVHTAVFPWQPDLYFPLMIANGVTGVRDMGAAFPIAEIDALRGAVAAGERIGPRIVSGTMVDGPTPVWPFALPAGTPDEARQAVAAIAEAGADFVKVYTLLPRDAFLAVAEAAAERGLPFAGHVPISVTAAEASDAGQRSIEHYSDSMLPYVSTDEDAILAELRAAAAGPDAVQAYGATFFAMLPRVLETIDPAKVEALAARLAANGTRFTPTLIIGQIAAMAGDPSLAADPRLRYMPQEIVAGWNAQPAGTEESRAVARRSLEIGAAMTKAMQEAGVPLMAGTDLGLPYLLPGFSLHDELALMVQAGLTPLEALQAATRNVAEGVGLGDELGTVEAGKLADLVLLDADPLADIGNTTKIAAVIANGRLIEQPELQGLLDSAERAAAAPSASPAP